ncbi:MAG: hypothetical protein HY235_20890 [Acidobacteria bacterium]|nr:hypothetical protein [Acidobacteriota bacterium]
MKELVWFENPAWEQHVIAGGFSRMINVAPIDANGDGIPELVLAHEFANVASKSVGRRRQAVNLPRTPPLARIAAPLTASEAGPPDYRGAVPVVMYRPPNWKRELINESIHGVMHGIFVGSWNGDGVEELLTASFEGLRRGPTADRAKWLRGIWATAGFWRASIPGMAIRWPCIGKAEPGVDKGGIAASGCAVADFDGDKRPDVACIGSATANLKVYRNLGSR